jgi:hypothetical protein
MSRENRKIDLLRTERMQSARITMQMMWIQGFTGIPAKK